MSKTIDQDGDPVPQPAPRQQHEWEPVRLGHSVLWCKHCKCTPNEAALVLGPYCHIADFSGVEP
jgi:hypothetical protein